MSPTQARKALAELFAPIPTKPIAPVVKGSTYLKLSKEKYKELCEELGVEGLRVWNGKKLVVI